MNVEQSLFDAQVEKVAEDRIQQILSDPNDLLRLIEKQTREIVSVKKELVTVHGELKQVSSDYARLTDAQGNYDMKDAAKLLKYKRSDGKQVGRTELFAFLRDVQFLNRNNTPSQSAIDNGWLDEVTGTFVKKGVETTYVKTVVTPKGIERIRRLLEDAFESWWSGE